MLKNNYHTHLIFCNHAVGYSEDYVTKAIELGFDTLGITDHAPILESFMTKEEYDKNLCFENMKYETLTTYLLDVNNAKLKYSDKINVLVGFETEFLPWALPFYNELRNLSDYLNLGVHYFNVDKKVIDTYNEVDYTNVSYYADNAIKAMETGLFNTLVHPDLFMYNYKSENGLREFDSHCKKASIKIIEAAIKNNVYLELNANGLRKLSSAEKKDYSKWLYPCREFWKLARKYKDLKIIIGADAHSPDALDNENVALVEAFSKKLGLNVLDKMEINH